MSLPDPAAGPIAPATRLRPFWRTLAAALALLTALAAPAASAAPRSDTQPGSQFDGQPESQSAADTSQGPPQAAAPAPATSAPAAPTQVASAPAAPAPPTLTQTGAARPHAGAASAPASDPHSNDPGWNRVLSRHANLPGRFLAVNKKAQQLLVMEKDNPGAPAATLPCSTGQVEGDKWEEGDKKTPEGVYFVGRKIASGLDFHEYGGLAYVLNYPNPIDRLRDKKGHGIWVHGKGYAIVPRDTAGCIALNTDQLVNMDAIMQAGLPVVVAEELGTASAPAAASETVAETLRTNVKKWAAAWADRSEAFFSFYDPAAYAHAQGESFAAFRAQKERLFAMLPWIQIRVDDIRILEGPGYWVTWFAQYYRAPNLTTEGIRRLYWQKDAAGEWRIVGMEWEPFDQGLEKVYLADLKDEMEFFIESWRMAWEKGDLDSYIRFYADDARQDARVGKKAIREHKASTWATGRPEKVQLSNLRLDLAQGGVQATMSQRYRNARGYEDQGKKTLLLRPDGTGGWRIEHENWSAI